MEYLEPSAAVAGCRPKEVALDDARLIFHAAERSSRHAGQIVTLAKIARG
jgi:hypothetical protein